MRPVHPAGGRAPVGSSMHGLEAAGLGLNDHVPALTVIVAQTLNPDWRLEIGAVAVWR
ncbi:hypothetical protein [Deinococcus koreensis]|uniref:hypothetical protein n=1 Tax=Deinococcus koreensis TaxID=2054903 RepID=UPI0013FDD6CC|nr:hypothetical protein [Deinococcus koreensis]